MEREAIRECNLFTAKNGNLFSTLISKEFWNLDPFLYCRLYLIFLILKVMCIRMRVELTLKAWNFHKKIKDSIRNDVKK
jgi:hypothetical protein